MSKMKLCIGVLAVLCAHDGQAAPPKNAAKCDGITSTTTPKWCVKPPAGYELEPPRPGKPDAQVFRDKASNQAFDVSWSPIRGGVDGNLQQMRKDVPIEGGKELKEEAVPGGKLFRFLAPNGETIVMVLAAAGPGPTPETQRVVTCRVHLAEKNAEFAKQLAACKSLKVLP
jgi:hypothetical protein